MGCGASNAQPAIFDIVEQGNDHKIRDMIRNDPQGATKGRNRNDDTVLHHAAYKSPSANCLKALLEAPGIDLNAKNKTGFTPMHMAMAHGVDECARELLRAGAKPDIGDTGLGNTPIHVAVVENKPSCLQAAVDCNMNLNLKNRAGMAPLHIAALRGHLECAQVLLTGTAEVNGLSDSGNTPLHEAAIAGQREIAEALVKASADRQVANREGKNAGQLAAAGGHRRLAEILGAAPKEEDILAGAVMAACGGGHFVEGDPQGLFPTGDDTRKRVQDLMDQTWKDTRTRDRVGAKVVQFEVVQVQQNSAKGLWERYQAAREDINRSYVAQLTDVKTVVESFEQGLYEPRNEQLNEFFLFHGSKPQAVVNICENGFNVDLSGSNRGSLYGPGIYCAESSAKADEYAEDDKDGLYVGLYAMLLCRVCLGNPVVTDDVAPDIEELARQLSTTDVHSIVGDREKARGTYREFILRNPDQVYPAYAIIYKRKED